MFKVKHMRSFCHTGAACLVLLVSSIVSGAAVASGKLENGFLNLDTSTEGHLMIGSIVNVETGVEVPPPEFILSLDCSDDRYDNKNLALVANGIHIVSGIPQGITCTITQVTSFVTDGYVLADEPRINPSQPVTITAGEMQKVEVINRVMSSTATTE